jgi:3-methyladenine DNA glycosylase AlkC
MSKKVFAITLYVETDNQDQVEKLADEVGRLACPEQDAAPANHSCPTPWFVVTSEADQPEEWRDLLNR